MEKLLEKRVGEKEAASILGISKMSLIRRRMAGDIRFYRVGSRILYGESHLAEFLTKCETDGLSTDDSLREERSNG